MKASHTSSRGALKVLATEEGYESFVIPDDVGGRYSVLTAVGLLPIACRTISQRPVPAAGFVAVARLPVAKTLTGNGV